MKKHILISILFQYFFIGFLLWVNPLNILIAQDTLPEFQVKRKEVFEFTKSPIIKFDGKDIVIEFESKDFCDATVVIEDAEGNIKRHVASGVLGKNAPEPFQKDSLNQKLIWDKKNDQGLYLDQIDDLTVRVSLGLKPVFEKNLFWSSYKRVGMCDSPIFAASEEGVFVFEGMGVDILRKYNHNGEYEKTIYPFSKAMLKSAKDLKYEKFPQDGALLPIKHGPKNKSTFFTFDGKHAHDKYGTAGHAMSINNKMIAIVAESASRIGVNGECPEAGFNGPSCYINLGSKIQLCLPLSAALSNDGKWIYTTGYCVNSGYQAPLNGDWLPVVMRAEFNSKEPAKVFIGDTKQASSGSGDGQFKVPLSVAVDSNNNILVADYMNDRIQVFSPEGKFLKAVPAIRPVVVGVNPKNNEISYCSWMILNYFVKKGESLEPKYFRLSSGDQPKVLFEAGLPFNGYLSMGKDRTNNLEYKIGFDFWAEEPRVWVLPGLPYNLGNQNVKTLKTDLKGTGVTVLKEKDKALVPVKDFHEDASKAVVRTMASHLIRQRMYVNQTNGMLYIGEGDSGEGKSFKQLVSINPNNNEQKLVELPFCSEDMCIDLDGFFYLRTEFEVVRYNPSTWKEIPFDYGVEQNNVSFDTNSTRGTNVISAIHLPSTDKGGPWWHFGGFAVGPNGDLAVSCFNLASGQSQVAKNEGFYSKDGKSKKMKQTYIPAIYPGRKVNWEIHIWDKHGKPKYEDAFPGVSISNGIHIDKDDNLYVLMDQNRMMGDKPYPLSWASTLVKVKPGKGKVISAEKDDVPLPLAKESWPNRSRDIMDGWVENNEWLYGGVGFSGMRCGGSDTCVCWNARPALDLFGRSFAPEIDHYSVAVLDTNGNLILRIGQYGNVDDGKPLVTDNGPKNSTSIGGDEVALYQAAYLATFSDRRLFISDGGNQRILSVKLDYHNNHKTKLLQTK